MATAQQTFVDQFVTLINANANMNSDVIASSPSSGLLRVTQKGTADPVVGYLAGGSTVSGAGTFVSHPVTGSPKYAELYFSWTLQPGDTIKLNVGATGRSLDLTYSMPPGTVVAPGGFDHSTIAAGGAGGAGRGVTIGGTGIGSAQHRRLVVMECGSASPSFGSLFALDPQDATGVPIPTFRVSAGLPVTGVTVGESIYSTATRNGYVWDGTAWREITASPIRSFPDDVALQADVAEKVGTYAVASGTGNMYVKTAGGWRRIGIAEFATYADLLAWDAVAGTEAISHDLDVLFLRTSDGVTKSWIPISQLVKAEADILTSPNVPGLAAIALDTGATFVNNGTRWIQDPIEHYTTEALLLAATSPDGHMAWADDTNVVFTRAGGTWHRISGPQVSVGTVVPTTPGSGDMFYDTAPTTTGLQLYDGAQWQVAGSPNGMLWMVGSIQQSMLTEAQFAAQLGAAEAGRWVLADGRSVAGTAYATVTGTATVPDFRGSYLRMAGVNATNATWDGGALGGWQSDTTRKPRTDFTGVTSTEGSHSHTVKTTGNEAKSGYIAGGGGAWFPDISGANAMYPAGNHTHTVTINGGGDPETRPKTYSVNYFIKVN